jgi:hypothetical protein
MNYSILGTSRTSDDTKYDADKILTVVHSKIIY